MRRSFIFGNFMRLLLAPAAALALWHWQPGMRLEESAALVLLWTSLLAAWSGWRLGQALEPLEMAASRLSDGPEQQPTADSLVYSELTDLNTALREGASQVQSALERSAESRRQLEILLDSMQDAVVAVDAAGRIQWSNRRMQRMMVAGASSGVRVGHALVQTIRDPDVLACVQDVLTRKGEAVRRATGLVPGKIFEVTVSPLGEGGAVAVMHDVTRVEEVEQTQRDFVANVSHELRTPLTSIGGYVETLLDHEAGLSSQGREFLQTILQNAGRMTRLTEDLLVMARVDAAVQTAAEPVSVSSETLLTEAVRQMSVLVRDNGATLSIVEATTCEVMADPEAVMQILGNLIENAVKYGVGRDSTRARVELTARQTGDWVEFGVRDFGAGMASEHLGRIFERFYRVDKTRSRESGGTGLGLSIARHMVEIQGGTIWAESSLGSGSRFAFVLPRNAAPDCMELHAGVTVP